MRKKIILSFLLSVIIIFSATLPAFAVDNSHMEYVTSINLKDDTHFSGNASDYADIVFSRVGGTDTRITNNGADYKVPIVYYSPYYWVAGQTYRIEFLFSSSNIDGMSIALSSTPKLNEGEQTYIADNVAEVNKSYNYSFVYSGEPYLIFDFVMPAHSSCVISDIVVTSYNPNAVVESQNQEIIEQNSERDDKLFNNGETYSFAEPDISDQLEMFNEGKQDLLENGGLITQSNRLVNGVKAFASFFTEMYSEFVQTDVTQHIPFLMYLSLICSLILLILGLLRRS